MGWKDSLPLIVKGLMPKVENFVVFFTSYRQWRALEDYVVRFTVSLIKKLFFFSLFVETFSTIRKHCHHVAFGCCIRQTVNCQFL